MKNKDKEIQAELETCRHFRYLVPNENANEMALNDPIYCEVCYKYLKNHWNFLNLYNKQLNNKQLEVA